MAGSFVIHQWRILSTVKKIILDRRGESLFVVRYGLLGHFERAIETPIEIMRGVTTATKLGGNMIYGGNVYGFTGKSFWFHKDGIVNKEIFEAAVSGRKITILD